MSIRLAIILIFALIVAAGAVLVTRSQIRPAVEPQEPKEYLYRLDPFGITSVSVKQGNRAQTFELGPDETWIFADESAAVSPERWGGVVGILSEPSARRRVMDVIDDPASYGLDTPSTSITTGLSDGQKLTIHLGDATPTGDDVYAQLEGFDILYMVPSEWTSVFSRFITDPPYLWLYLNPVDEQHHQFIDSSQIQVLSVIHEGVSKKYLRQDDGTWVFDDAAKTPVDPAKWNEATAQLGGVIANRRPQRLFGPLKYGLGSQTTTTVELSFDRAEKFMIHIRLGAITDDGNYQYAENFGDERERLMVIDKSYGEQLSRLVTNPPLP